MGFILIAAVLICGGIWYIVNRMKHERDQNTMLAESMVFTLSLVMGIILIFVGIFGFGMTKSEEVLLETKDVIGISQEDSTYVFLDAENNCYYIYDEKLVVIKDGYKYDVECVVVKGDYDKAFVERYKADYKMNFWTFAISNNECYKIYIPQNMTIIN